MIKKLLIPILLIISNTIYGQFNKGFNYNINYHRLEWKVNPEERFIEGVVTSYFTPNEALNEMWFDMAMSLKADSVIYHGKKLNVYHSMDKLKIKFNKTLQAGLLDSISVFYHGKPNETKNAFFIDLHQNSPILFTLSEPYGAKEWWPCKQSLTDKIDSIDIFISHPQKYKAASNGVLMSETKFGNQTITHWKHKHPVAAYLIAIAVTNYKVFSEFVPLKDDTVEVLNYVYPESMDYAKEKIKRVVPVMQLFSNLFIPYPFADEKYGHAQFSWGAGGMEHQTMSFMSTFEHELLSHELAHQWFGDYITCKTWKEIWINEGFATYCTGLTYEHMFEGKYWDRWKNLMIEDITKESDGSVIVDDTSSVERIFDHRLSYNKAAMVLHMLRWEIGDEAFYTAIKNYLTDSCLINNYASTNDLKNHFEKTSQKSLDYFFDDWIYGEGYPVYQPELQQNENGNCTLTINQKQTSKKVDFFELHVPLQFIGENKDSIIVFNNDKQNQIYTFKLNFRVKKISIDPERWLITKAPLELAINTYHVQNISIYPNPANSYVYIDMPSNIIIKNIKLYNIYGQQIKQFNIKKRQPYRRICVQDIRSGIYFIEIITKTGKQICKFIIK